MPPLTRCSPSHTRWIHTLLFPNPKSSCSCYSGWSHISRNGKPALSSPLMMFFVRREKNSIQTTTATTFKNKNSTNNNNNNTIKMQQQQQFPRSTAPQLRFHSSSSLSSSWDAPPDCKLLFLLPVRREWACSYFRDLFFPALAHVKIWFFSWFEKTPITLTDCRNGVAAAKILDFAMHVRLCVCVQDRVRADVLRHFIYILHSCQNGFISIFIAVSCVSQRHRRPFRLDHRKTKTLVTRPIRHLGSFLLNFLFYVTLKFILFIAPNLSQSSTVDDKYRQECTDYLQDFRHEWEVSTDDKSRRTHLQTSKTDLTAFCTLYTVQKNW